MLRASYTGVITGLLPRPVTVQGGFFGSRPTTPGSQRLSVEAEAQSVPLGGSTAITATLSGEAMRLITATNRVTFTTDLGTVMPVAADTVEGVVVGTFTAGAVPGQADIFATTGLVTGTVRIEIEGVYRAYLPVIMSGGFAVP